MHKLMEGRNIDPTAMGFKSSQHINRGLIDLPPDGVDPEQSSRCILISNMFDQNSVDLDKDPTFYVEIKNQISQVAQDCGKIDIVFVEQKSAGNVWLRFGGDPEEAASSAVRAIKDLDKRLFDGRELSVKQVPEALMISKLK